MKFVKEYLPYIAVIILILLLRLYVISPVQVDGASMAPTLHDNQILILKKYDHNFERFDIVVLKYHDEKLVKRIIGLPGEYIAYRGNKLWINGKVVEEKFLPSNIQTNDFKLENLGYNRIPDGYYFVVGDNRGDSLDSRFIGLIPKKSIEGKIGFSLYPFNTFGKIS